MPLIQWLQNLPPPAPPPPPPPPPRAGGYSAGGGGTIGGWVRDDQDDYVFTPPEPEFTDPPPSVPAPAPVDLSDRSASISPLGAAAKPSLAEALAELLGPGAAGFAGTRALGRIGGKHLGKHGELVASAASVAATVAVSGKMKRFGRIRASLIAGSTLAALDGIVKTYLGPPEARPRSAGRPDVVRLPDARSFMLQALAVRADVQIKQTLLESRGVLVIGYAFVTHDPATLWTYREIVPIDGQGMVDIDHTLMARLR